MVLVRDRDRDRVGTVRATNAPAPLPGESSGRVNPADPARRSGQAVIARTRPTTGQAALVPLAVAVPRIVPDTIAAPDPDPDLVRPVDPVGRHRGLALTSRATREIDPSKDRASGTRKARRAPPTGRVTTAAPAPRLEGPLPETRSSEDRPMVAARDRQARAPLVRDRPASVAPALRPSRNPRVAG